VHYLSVTRKINCTSTSLVKREQLHTWIAPGLAGARLRLDISKVSRHFDHPAYRSRVAGAAICIVCIVAPRKSPILRSGLLNLLFYELLDSLRCIKATGVAGHNCSIKI
jgi:hypothetical protein